MHPRLQSLEYRIYDLGDPPPREPTIVPSTAWIKPTGSGLPAEVAIVLSFYGSRNLPRQRGRLFIGPLDTGVLSQATNAVVRPALESRDAIRRGAVNVLNTTQNLTWVVISPTAATATVIENGWIDDAFDTQRRRGVAPSSRILFPIPA
jgi:hypothetical protein